MGLRTLQAVIDEARQLAGDYRCADGKHQWQSIGGRHCPEDLTEGCSQAVYHCPICDCWDYGEPGGPGAADCEMYCRNGDLRDRYDYTEGEAA